MNAESDGKMCDYIAEGNYTANLYRSMDSFRKQEILCDTALVVEGVRFPAHKNVLAASSAYFLGLFTTDMKEMNASEVNLDGFKSFIMEDLLNYIYTGEVSLKEANVKDLVFAADYLLISGLKRKGSAFLEETLTPDNCLSIRSFAETYDCPELQIKAECYILDNFIAVCKTEEFLMLDSEQLERLVSCEGLVVEKESQVYEGLLRWVKYDVENRKMNFPTLLRCIRLPFISKYYIVETIETEELVYSNLECMKLIYEVMKHFAFRTTLSEDTTTSLVPRPRTCIEDNVDAIVTIWGPGDELRSSTQCYIPADNRWYSLSPMLIPRFSHGAVHCEGFIYTVGGVSLNGHLSSMERFDYRTNTWSGVAPMNKEISALGVAELDGFLYTVGGWNRGRPLSTVSRYDPNINRWQDVAPLSTSRGGPCVIACKHALYAIGGKTELENEADVSVYMNTAEKYDARANSWVEIPPLQTRRAYAGGVAVNEKLYVVGGTQDDLLSSHSTCEVYDIESQTWSFMASLTVPRALGGVVFFKGNIYVLGGKKSCREKTDKVEMYDFELGEWRVVGTVPNCIGGIQCCSVSINRELVNSLPKLT